MRTDGDMTEDEAKEFALANVHFPDYTLLPLIEKADRGFVVWTSAPPPGIAYHTHKYTFIDALMTGLSYCETNCLDDWVVLGPAALAIARTIPDFVEQPERSTGQMTYVGKLKAISVYANPRAERNSFWMGHATMCCRGTIEDEPHGHACAAYDPYGELVHNGG